jgi:hypothetical protein
MKKIIIAVTAVATVGGAAVVLLGGWSSPAGAWCYGGGGNASNMGWCCPMWGGGAFATEAVDTKNADSVLYATKCGTCHGLPARNLHTAAAWEDRVARCEIYITQHENMLGATGFRPTSEERKRILDYLAKGAAK